jgi:hypothetical protein
MPRGTWSSAGARTCVPSRNRGHRSLTFDSARGREAVASANRKVLVCISEISINEKRIVYANYINFKTN